MSPDTEVRIGSWTFVSHEDVIKCICHWKSNSADECEKTPDAMNKRELSVQKQKSLVVSINST